MTKLLRAVLPMVAGGLLLAGCTTTEGGTASPASTSSAAQTASSGTPGTPGAASTKSLDPCDLLTPADVAGLARFGAADKKDVPGGRTCGYTKQVASASEEGLSVGVAVRDAQSIDSVNDAGGGKTTGNVNGRKAIQAPSPPAGCTLALGVGDSARVDVVVVSADSAKACDIASQIADKVEPKLPKG